LPFQKESSENQWPCNGPGCSETFRTWNHL